MSGLGSFCPAAQCESGGKSINAGDLKFVMQSIFGFWMVFLGRNKASGAVQGFNLCHNFLSDADGLNQKQSAPLWVRGLPQAGR